MRKKFAINALIVMSGIFILGLILVLYSGEIGQHAGSKAIRNQGGSMDTSKYERIIKTTTVNFQIVGGVLSIIGGCGLIVSGYSTYREL